MTTFTELLKKDSPQVQTGEVLSMDENQYYLVRVGERQIKIKSTVPGQMNIGSRVILTETDEGIFIIAKDKIRDRSQNVLIITG